MKFCCYFFWFTKYKPECTHPIRLQDTFIIKISASSALVSLIFLRKDIPQGKVTCEITTLG